MVRVQKIYFMKKNYNIDESRTLDNDSLCSVCNYNTGIGPVVLSNKISSKLVC
jgi:hypothetical protein